MKNKGILIGAFLMALVFVCMAAVFQNAYTSTPAGATVNVAGGSITGAALISATTISNVNSAIVASNLTLSAPTALNVSGISHLNGLTTFGNQVIATANASSAFLGTFTGFSPTNQTDSSAPSGFSSVFTLADFLANTTSNLSGDVTGNPTNNTVALVGGQTAANVAAGAVLANAATSFDTANTIAKRDGSGGASFVSMAVGDTSKNSPQEFVITFNTGTFTQATGDAGLIIQSLSTNLFQSGTSVFISATGKDGSGNAIVTDRVAGSFAYVAPGHLEELCTGCFISVFNNATNVEGYGVCSPGIGFDSGNYSLQWNEFRPTTFWGVPFFQPGVYKPSGHGYTFHVSGVTTVPTSPTAYTNSAGVLFIVNATSIAAGSGTVNTSATAAPAGSGTLGKVTITGQANVGDNTLTYSSVDTITWAWSVNVNPNNGIFNAFKSESLTGTLTVNGNVWNATQSGQSNLINGAMIGPNSTLTVSNIVLSTTPPGSALSLDITGGGGTGLKAVGNGLALIHQSTAISTINNNGSTVGNSQIRLEGGGTGNELNPQNDGAWDLGDSTHRFGTVYAKTNTATGLSSYRAGFQAIGNLSTSQAVTFTTPLASAVGTNYSVSISSDSTLASAIGFSAGSKTTNGFTINLSAGVAGGIGVDYTATPYQ